MSDLKQLIRPFQSVDVTYPRRIVKVDATPPDNVVYTVGGAGGGVKTLGYSYSYSLTTYMEKRQQVVPGDPDPPLRPKHVKRYPGKTRKADGTVEKVPGTWIDVERRDTLKTRESGAESYQVTRTELKWYDDDDGNVPNSTRKIRTVTVVPPDADDPDELFFEIDVNDAISVRDNDQLIRRKFDNTETNENRRPDSQLRRFKHYDTPYDDDPKYDDGGIIVDYQRTPGTKDDDQYLDVEIPSSYRFDYFRRNLAPSFEHWQRTVSELDNDHLINDSEEPDTSYGEEINPPYRLDPVQNIINCKFAHDVIVVIVDIFAAAPATIVDDKAKVLRVFPTSAFNPGLADGICTAYKVSANAGEFLQTGASIAGEQYAVVFAIDGDIDDSLDRAVAQIQPVMTAIYLNNSGADPATIALPNDIAAPGVIWVAGMFRMPAGHPITWKIKFQNHRDKKSPTPPPNRMVQCYPLTTAYTTAEQNFFGYILYTYRLDRKGTETSYGSHRMITSPLPARINGLMPPPWFRVISDQGPEGIRGILFGDPPPLIAVDTPSA